MRFIESDEIHIRKIADKRRSVDRRIGRIDKSARSQAWMLDKRPGKAQHTWNA